MDGVDLLSEYYDILGEFAAEDGETLLRLMRLLVQEESEKGVADYSRAMSAVMAAAFIIMNPDPKRLDIHSLNLELPDNVKRNLKDTLRPYLEALSVEGYETTKRKKSFIIGNTASGKTSLCTSLQAQKARYAFDTRYKEDNKEETKFMDQLNIHLLSKDQSGKLEETPCEENDKVKVYNWNAPSEGEDPAINDVNEDELCMFDCGGHSEYQLLNSVSLTPKSLIIVTFRAHEYMNHEHHYHQMVGSYIDIILSKTTDVVILLVAGWADELQDENGFLRKDNNKELKEIFEIAKRQIKDRLTQQIGESDPNLPRPRLVSCQGSAIFLLSNTYRTGAESKLTDEQRRILMAISLVVSDEQIIGTNMTSNAPRIWEDFKTKMMEDEQCARNHFCRLEKGKEIFEMFRKPDQHDSNISNLNKTTQSETKIVEYLLKMLQWWNEYGERIQIARNRIDEEESRRKKRMRDSETDSDLDLDSDLEPEAVIEKEKLEDHAASAHELEDEILTPAIEASSPTDKSSEADAVDRNLQDTLVALEYLRTTGGIFWFNECSDLIFPNLRAVINTFQLILDHKLPQTIRMKTKQESSNYKVDWIRKGIIVNEALDKLFEVENEQTDQKSKKDLIDQTIFRELLQKLGLAKECTIGSKSRQILIIPSLINRSIQQFTRGKSVDEIYDEYKDELRYTLKFGEGKGFASSGLIEALLVQLYSSEGLNWIREAAVSGKLSCYRENVEKRTPGLVFAIQFTDPGKTNKRITILEEEKLDKTGFYKTRIITIFVRPGQGLRSSSKYEKDEEEKGHFQPISLESTWIPEELDEIRYATFSALKNMHQKSKSMPPESFKVVDFGINCFRCMLNGTEGFFHNTDSDQVELCQPENEYQPKHEIWYKCDCDGGICKHQTPVIKRAAYAPKKLEITQRAVFGMIDVVKDSLAGYGYLAKAASLGEETWQAGLTQVLGIYTIAAMFYPLVAYVALFTRLLKGRKARWFYIPASVILTPFIGLISLVHSLFDKTMLHSADLAHDIEKATEASINFIFQLVALSSGVIGSEDYIFQFTTVAGAHYGLRQGDVVWFSISWSVFTMVSLCLKNNNIYTDLATRENSLREANRPNDEGSGWWEKFTRFCEDVGWKIRGILKYGAAPVVKFLSSIAFRLCAFPVIIIYLANFYRGIFLLIPLALFIFVSASSYIVSTKFLKLKDDEAIINSTSSTILPMYFDIHPVEGDKSKEVTDCESTEEKDDTKLKRLDYYRDKTDFRTRFLNITIAVGSSLLFLLLVVLLIVINQHMLCIPDNFLLNPPNLRIPGCNLTNSPNRTGPNMTSGEQGSHPTTTSFYALNMVVICILFPLGLTSVVISASQFWIPKVQELSFVIKLGRTRSVQIDSIKSIVSFVCGLFLALLLLPTGISVANLAAQCYWDAVLNLISSITITICGSGALMYLDLKNSWKLVRGKRKMEEELREKRKQMTKADIEDMFCERLKKMILSWSVTSIILVISVLHILETFDVLRDSYDKAYCSDEMKNLASTLITYNMGVSILAILLTAFNTLQYHVGANIGQLATENHSNQDTEAQADDPDRQSLTANLDNQNEGNDLNQAHPDGVESEQIIQNLQEGNQEAKSTQAPADSIEMQLVQ